MEIHIKVRQRLKLFARCLACFGALALGLAASRSHAAHGSVNAADDGVALYEAKCAGCHGKDGRGSAFGKQNGAPDFTDAKWQETHAAAELKTTVANGKGGKMPAWKGKLSAAEIEAVVARVRAFGAKH